MSAVGPRVTPEGPAACGPGAASHLSPAAGNPRKQVFTHEGSVRAWRETSSQNRRVDGAFRTRSAPPGRVAGAGRLGAGERAQFPYVLSQKCRPRPPAPFFS